MAPDYKRPTQELADELKDLEDVDSLARLHQIWADVLDQIASDEHRDVLVTALGSKRAAAETPGLATTDDRLSYARRVASQMDRRVSVLAERAASEPPLWASLALGELPEGLDAQEAWKRRAGAVEAYRGEDRHGT